MDHGLSPNFNEIAGSQIIRWNYSMGVNIPKGTLGNEASKNARQEHQPPGGRESTFHG